MSWSSEGSHARWALVALGFSAAVAQSVLLREAMAALGGSELAWGAVLAVWLAAMGVGALAGAGKTAPRGGAAVPTILALLAGAGVLLLRATPALLGAAPGEAAATWSGLWAWLPAVVPAALAGGWGFASLAQAGVDPGQAYALEGAGALVGGVAFTFVLAPWGSAAAIVLTAAAVAAAWLWPARQRVLALAVCVLAVGVVRPAGDLLARATWRWSRHVGSLAVWRETARQRLELSTGEPASLYGDGHLLATIPDPYRTASRAHLAMLLHPHPQRVLAIGALADGSFATMLRHPIERLDVVEEDPGVAALVLRRPALARAAADVRVHLHFGDPLRVLRLDGRWDLIVLFDPDPATLRLDRTRTLEFFRSCAAHLAPGGVVVVRVGVNDGYLGGAGGQLLSVLAATIKLAFGDVTAVPGEEILLVAGASGASVSLDPATLATRWAERGISDPEFDPAVLPTLVDPSRERDLARFLTASSAPVNRAAHPRAVLLAAALVEARGSPPLLRAATWLAAQPPAFLLALAALAAAVVPLRALTRRGSGIEVAALAGFLSMGWFLLLISAWQATEGAVYSEIGALSAAFMAGLVGGTVTARRRTGRRDLAILLVGGAALSALIAAGVALRFPRASVVPLLLAAGAITGMAFPPAARLAARRQPARAAGRGFGADEAGAALGALCIGLVALPWAGMSATGAGLALMAAAGAVGLSVAGDRPG